MSCNNEVAVSIVCNAYNHEEYIRDALSGFVMQKTTFPFEVLVHDDASTDKTAEIIREYERDYPDLIKPIYQTENQYSKGGGLVGKIQFARARGKYIAFCEGDDFWTDPLKIQKQYDALEAHPEIDMCAHTVEAVKANTLEPNGFIRPAKRDTVFTTEEVIRGGGGFVGTVSLFYRRGLVENMPPFRQFLMLDYTMQIQGSLRGGILFLDDCMAKYRVASNGSWTVRMAKDRLAYGRHYVKMVDMLKILDKDTEGKYSEVIAECIWKLEREWTYTTDLYDNGYSLGFLRRNKEYISKMNFKVRILTTIKCVCPFLTTSWRQRRKQNKKK